ncbi:hypothetical protein [Phenylobacterium sp.]|uniref:hypothetical protein n=1 Tax=Phenylobacterium sp. TaxID=1871053 RepID=UPI002EDAE48D
MTRAAALIATAVLALAAAPALAQPPPDDPIDALLRQKPVETEEPDVAAPDPVERNPLPAQPQPYVPARPFLTEPVFLDQVGKSPDGPPSPADQAYEARVRSSAAAVRSFQGPMEGGWTLLIGGRDAFALQLIDRGGWVDGAWRDLRRPGARDASGFIEEVRRAGGDLTFRFAEGIVAVLRPSQGRWTGQLTEGGKSEAATMVRRTP